MRCARPPRILGRASGHLTRTSAQPDLAGHVLNGTCPYRASDARNIHGWNPPAASREPSCVPGKRSDVLTPQGHPHRCVQHLSHFRVQ